MTNIAPVLISSTTAMCMATALYLMNSCQMTPAIVAGTFAFAIAALRTFGTTKKARRQD